VRVLMSNFLTAVERMFALAGAITMGLACGWLLGLPRTSRTRHGLDVDSASAQPARHR
jgi:hypothetical protein